MDLVIVAVEDLHLDLRIVLLEKMHDVRQPHRRHARKAADAQSALDLVVDVEGRLAQLFLLVYHFADVGDEPLSVVGQDDTLLRPREQLHAELLLEVLYLHAQRRLSDETPFGRKRKAAEIHHRKQIFQLYNRHLRIYTESQKYKK